MRDIKAKLSEEKDVIYTEIPEKERKIDRKRESKVEINMVQ